MTFVDWIPAISTSTLMSVVGFLVGVYYKAKIEKGVQHNLDQKLEELRAKLRRDEEELKANLRSKDDQIAALRTGALSGMATRQGALDRRRMEAVEKVWASIIDRAPLKNLSKMVAALNVDVVLDASTKQDEEGRKAREIAEIIWKTSGLDNLKSFESPDKDRPFVPTIVWALFSAYRQILNLPIAQMSVMRTGVGKRVLADPKAILDMVKSALPHQSEFIDKFGTSALYYLVEELEERLLSEIIASLESTASDDKSITQAAAILVAIDKVTASSESEVEIPDRLRSHTQHPPHPEKSPLTPLRSPYTRER